MLYDTLDEAYIARCLVLAELGSGTVSPNPLVGAVVLDEEGRKVGEGYHRKAGEAHAEVMALEQAGPKAKNGTLYVNLEPCNHFGRTPPCTQRIIEAGIQRVVCGTLDSNPLVAGAGRDALQNARISVRYGFLEKECKALNALFFHYITTKMPFVGLKLGLTLDGKIANRHGDSQWLTGMFSRQAVHHLRHQYDAILTTAETVMRDNPQLTVRHIPTIHKQPIKIVLDRQCRLDPERYPLFQASDASCFLVTSQETQANLPEEYLEKARHYGIEILTVGETGNKLNMKSLFLQLGERGIASILVEAGGRLAGSLLQEELVQRLYLFYAPKLLQDNMATPAFGQHFQLELPDAPQLTILATRQLDRDWLVEAQPNKRSRHS